MRFRKSKSLLDFLIENLRNQKIVIYDPLRGKQLEGNDIGMICKEGKKIRINLSNTNEKG